jgi:hypothetical protein
MTGYSGLSGHGTPLALHGRRRRHGASRACGRGASDRSESLKTRACGATRVRNRDFGESRCLRRRRRCPASPCRTSGTAHAHYPAHVPRCEYSSGPRSEPIFSAPVSIGWLRSALASDRVPAPPKHPPANLEVRSRSAFRFNRPAVWRLGPVSNAACARSARADYRAPHQPRARLDHDLSVAGRPVDHWRELRRSVCGSLLRTTRR